MTVEAPVLDAPTKTETSATEEADKSIIDTKVVETPDGKGTDKTGATSQDKSKVTESKPEEKATVKAPEKYADPKLPEGMIAAPQPIREKFDGLAKEFNLTQEQYQKVIDVQAEYAAAVTKEKLDQFKGAIETWKKETQTMLGADSEKKLAVVAKAIDRVFTDPKENQEFREMMNDTGLGNWKGVVKVLQFIGEKLSEDKFVEGAKGQAEQTTAKKLYPNLA